MIKPDVLSVDGPGQVHMTTGADFLATAFWELCLNDSQACLDNRLSGSEAVRYGYPGHVSTLNCCRVQDEHSLIFIKAI